MKKITKNLSPLDAVPGIGRKATDAELEEYLKRVRKESFKPLNQVREEIRSHLIKLN